MAYKGVKYASFAKASYTDGSAPVYTDGRIFGAMISCEITYTKSDVKLYADNRLHMVEKGVTGGTININVASFEPSDAVDIVGLVADGASEGGYTVKDGDPPVGGFGCVMNGESDDGSEYFEMLVAYKVEFSMPDMSVNTKGENTEFQTHTLQGDIMGVNVDNDGNAFVYTKRFNTEAAALAALKAKLNIAE